MSLNLPEMYASVDTQDLSEIDIENSRNLNSHSTEVEATKDNLDQSGSIKGSIKTEEKETYFSMYYYTFSVYD